MGLETATYISGLNANNPVGASDPKSQGDDHLRLIKSTLLNSFPGITGAVVATHTELNYLDNITGVTGSGNLVLSASPTFSGTAAFAGITCSGIVAGGTVAAAAFSGPVPDASLSSNIFKKNEQIQQTINGSFLVASATPIVGLSETDQALDEKNWLWLSISKSLELRAYDDALAVSSRVAFAIKRGVGVALTGINYGNSTDSIAHIFFGSSVTRANAGGMLYNASTPNTGGKITITATTPGSAAAVGAPGDLAFVY